MVFIRYNALLISIRVSLDELQKGIKGLVVMSSELEEIFTCISEGRVPSGWLNGKCKFINELNSFFLHFQLSNCKDSKEVLTNSIYAFLVSLVGIFILPPRNKRSKV